MSISDEVAGYHPEPTEYEAACEYRRELDPRIAAAERESARRAFISSVDRAARAEQPRCPLCSGPMWDNRPTKRNPRAPDFKCQDAECNGVIWPPRAPTPRDANVAVEPADWFHSSDGRYFASDADRRAHQRALDEKAARNTAKRNNRSAA